MATSGNMSFSDMLKKVRSVIQPSIAKMSSTWSECKNVLWNTRNVMYILCLLAIVLLVSQVMDWNKNFIVFLSGSVTVFAVYGALVVSKQSCFSVFDSAVGSIYGVSGTTASGSGATVASDKGEENMPSCSRANSS